MVLHPSRYAELLADKIRRHKVNCWLVNTGWSGGPYGIGERMAIKHTRALVNAALEGSLEKVDFEVDPIFGLQIPTDCPDVPKEILKPKNTWSDKDAYDSKADQLARLFVDNFRQFEDQAADDIKAAGPQILAKA